MKLTRHLNQFVRKDDIYRALGIFLIIAGGLIWFFSIVIGAILGGAAAASHEYILAISLYVFTFLNFCAALTTLIICIDP